MIESGALHLKYRPRDFNEFVGNKAMVNSLRSVLDRERVNIPHSFMFTGQSGCGKTTLARIVANKLGCSDRDFIEINVADKRGIDSAREIISTMHYKPMMGNARVYLMDEVQMANSFYQASLLKALEDTPSHVYFLLCTTEPGKILPTIRTRCSTFNVSRLNSSAIIGLLKSILEREKVEMEGNVLRRIAQSSEGSPRQALVLLDKVIDLELEQILEALERAREEESQIIDLCRSLLERAPWKDITSILKGLDMEEERVRYAVLGYFTKVLLNAKNTEKQLGAVVIIEFFSEPFYNSGKAGLVCACFNCWVKN